MREISVPSRRGAMLESLRAIGYSFEAALADIVDNSIAALSTAVDIQFRPHPRAYVAVIDDGFGMTGDELVEAMRHGGRGPSVGREGQGSRSFRLGPQTTSLSQCRRLTVATLKDQTLSGATWNLDRIEETGDWTLGLLSAEDLANVLTFWRSSVWAMGLLSYGRISIARPRARWTPEPRWAATLTSPATTFLSCFIATLQVKDWLVAFRFE